MHTYIQKYILLLPTTTTEVHAYIHTYRNICIYTSRNTCIYAYRNTCIHTTRTTCRNTCIHKYRRELERAHALYHMTSSGWLHLWSWKCYLDRGRAITAWLITDDRSLNSLWGCLRVGSKKFRFVISPHSQWNYAIFIFGWPSHIWVDFFLYFLVFILCTYLLFQRADYRQ